jgi:hypothetical protein
MIIYPKRSNVRPPFPSMDDDLQTWQEWATWRAEPEISSRNPTGACGPGLNVPSYRSLPYLKEHLPGYQQGLCREVVYEEGQDDIDGDDRDDDDRGDDNDDDDNDDDDKDEDKISDTKYGEIIIGIARGLCGNNYVSDNDSSDDEERLTYCTEDEEATNTTDGDDLGSRSSSISNKSNDNDHAADDEEELVTSSIGFQVQVQGQAPASTQAEPQDDGTTEEEAEDEAEDIYSAQDLPRNRSLRSRPPPTPHHQSFALRRRQQGQQHGQQQRRQQYRGQQQPGLVRSSTRPALLPDARERFRDAQRAGFGSESGPVGGRGHGRGRDFGGEEEKEVKEEKVVYRY